MIPHAPLNEALELASEWPQLLAQAQRLAHSFALGGHGRRRAGAGDIFWQFRAAQAGDSLRAIDWRRSARADDQFVRENEWQAAKAVKVWVDTSASMHFASEGSSKHFRAAMLALAVGVLLSDAGEKIGSSDGLLPAKPGRAQIPALAQVFSRISDDDFGTPQTDDLKPHSLAVFVSDFFGDFAKLERAVTSAADQQIAGALLMVLDPQEVNFPFAGRTLFESMSGGLRYESQKADGLRAKYRSALQDRQAALASLAQSVGWQFQCHTTDQPASAGLMWLYQALEYRR